MGDCSEELEASGGNGSRKAHHVSISPPKDRGGAEETVGNGAGGAEEGGLKSAEPAAKLRQALLSQQILHDADPFLIE
jgi:hypothetical protein